MQRFWRRSRGAQRAVGPERVLAEAAELAGSGKFEEAIGILTDANRAQRDRGVEERLVELRSDAFTEVEWPVTPPAWPDEVEDLFPGTLIPEISHRDLTVDAIRSGVQHHGSLIVRGLVPPERVDRLIDDVDRALIAFDAHAAGIEDPAAAGCYLPFERDQISDRDRKRSRGSVMTVDSPPAMFDVVEAFEACGLADIVRAYFGEAPLLLARKGTLRKISHDGNTGGWHQDGAFMGADIRSLNVWLALTHCGDDAPGLDVVGRRLDEIVQTGEGAFEAWATSPDAAEEVAAGALVRPIFDAGDVLIFDQMNLHRTAIDPGMTNDRYAIETWLSGPSSYGVTDCDRGGDYTPRDQIPILF